MKATTVPLVPEDSALMMNEKFYPKPPVTLEDAKTSKQTEASRVLKTGTESSARIRSYREEYVPLCRSNNSGQSQMQARGTTKRAKMPSNRLSKVKPATGHSQISPKQIQRITSFDTHTKDQTYMVQIEKS